MARVPGAEEAAAVCVPAGRGDRAAIHGRLGEAMVNGDQGAVSRRVACIRAPGDVGADGAVTAPARTVSKAVGAVMAAYQTPDVP